MNSLYKEIYQEATESAAMNILIVDDDQDILESLKDILELEIEGCVIEIANNVETARILAKKKMPDIVLLDIKIGQDNGLDLIPELKSISNDMVCIMMTAYRDNEYTVTAVRSGADDYLFKPIKPLDLIDTVTRLFAQQLIKRKADLSEKRFITIFEQGTQCLFILDKDGILIDANLKAMGFIDNKKEDVIGLKFSNSPWFTYSPETKKRIENGLLSVSKGNLFNADMMIVDVNQNKLFFDFYMKPVFNSKNMTEQIIVESRDITERKQAENEIKELNATLELRVKERTLELEQSMLLLSEENKERIKAEEIANKASEAKSDFLSRMSHELRTPMNAILGFGQLLELDSSNFNEDQNSNIQEILSSGNHLLRLINDVLDLTEIESGKIDVVMGDINLDDVLTDVASLMKPQMEARQINQTDNILGKGYVLHADAYRLKKVLINFISNAIKYNHDNGTITLNAVITDKQYLRINITDTGEGISEDDIGNLFTSFERLNTQYNVEGTGIGLVITKSLVELMNGRVGVESTLGEGSTFWFELPLANT